GNLGVSGATQGECPVLRGALRPGAVAGETPGARRVFLGPRLGGFRAFPIEDRYPRPGTNDARGAARRLATGEPADRCTAAGCGLSFREAGNVCSAEATGQGDVEEPARPAAGILAAHGHSKLALAPEEFLGRARPYRRTLVAQPACRRRRDVGGTPR